MSAAEHEIRKDDSAGGKLPGAGAKLLLDRTTPEILSRNAFRITGLAADATSREIASHANKLKMLAELGRQASAHTGAMALPDLPTIDEIREAIQKLKDPEQRVLHELFWFWPRKFGESKSDPAIQALEAGNADAAFEIWTELESDAAAGHVARHNIAVLRQLMALEWEHFYVASSEFSDDRRKEVDAYWRAAFQRWKALFDDDLFWESMAGRIKQLDDPRLTGGLVASLREMLPHALLKISAELALEYAEAGKMDLASIHIRLMQEAATANAQVARTGEMVLQPAASRLRQHIQRALARTTKTPAEAMTAARELLDQARRSLPIFEVFFGKDGETPNALSDDVAEACNRMQVAYHIKTHDAYSAFAIAKRALSLARSSGVRRQIQNNLDTLTRDYRGIELFASAFTAFDNILTSASDSKTKLARIIREVMPGLRAAKSPHFHELADRVAVFLRDASAGALEHSDIAAASQATTEALAIVRDPALKQELLRQHEALIRHPAYRPPERPAPKKESETRRAPAPQPPPNKFAERLKTTLTLLRGIDESLIASKSRLAKVKQKIMPVLREIVRDEGAGGPNATRLADSIGVSLRAIFLLARRNHADPETASEAIELALEIVRDPELKHQLTQDKAQLANEKIEHVKQQWSVRQKTAHTVLEVLRKSPDAPSVRFARFQTDAEPIITWIFNDSKEPAENLSALVNAATRVLWEISAAAWDLEKDFRSNPFKDLKTALAANEMAAKYTLDKDVRKQLAAERAKLLKIDANLGTGAATGVGGPRPAGSGPKPAAPPPPPRDEKKARTTRPAPSPPIPPQKRPKRKIPAGLLRDIIMWLIFLTVVGGLIALRFLAEQQREAIAPSVTGPMPPVFPTANQPGMPLRVHPAATPTSNGTLPNSGSRAGPASGRQDYRGTAAGYTPDQLLRELEQAASATPRPEPVVDPLDSGSRPGPAPSRQDNRGAAAGYTPDKLLRELEQTASATPRPEPAADPVELKQDKLAIDRETAKVNAMEGQLHQESRKLDAAKKSADQLQKQATAMYAQIHEAHATLDSSDRSAVLAYQNLVNRYTALLENMKSQNATVTQMVSHYSADDDNLRQEKLTLSNMTDRYRARLP